MALGVGGHADGEVADLVDEPDQLDGVGEVVVVGRLVGGVGRRVAGQGEDVGDPRRLVLLQEAHQLLRGVCPMQVRWAMAVMPVSRSMWTTTSRVRSRVEPPAP